MTAITICSDFGALQNSQPLFPLFPHLFDMKWTGWHDLSFLNVELWANFSLSSFTFIKRLFSSSSLSAIGVVLSAYLKLLIFLPAILIPASSPVFLMMYSALKLNKQGDNIQPWRTPFPIWNQSVVPCPVLTVASWPAYRFLKRQVRCLVFPSPSEFSPVYCDPHSLQPDWSTICWSSYTVTGPFPSCLSSLLTQPGPIANHLKYSLVHTLCYLIPFLHSYIC